MTMRSKVEASHLVFLDFEASSLSENSWPIEIGYSRLIDNTTVTHSSLIQPDPSWDLADWNMASQAVHKVPLDDLQSAPQAAEVALEYYPVLSHYTLFSDQPKFEEYWLAKLLGAAGLAPIEVMNVSQAAEYLLDSRQLDYFYERLARLPVPHRAGPDSARFTEALKYAMKK